MLIGCFPQRLLSDESKIDYWSCRGNFVNVKTSCVKYTAEQIRDISTTDWMELMVRELNENGFRKQSLDPETGCMNVRPYCVVGDLRTFILNEVDSYDEINFLGEIGLINNGRCSLCGRPLRRTPKIFKSSDGLRFDFDVCNECVIKHTKKKDKGQILVIILILVFFSWYIIHEILT